MHEKIHHFALHTQQPVLQLGKTLQENGLTLRVHGSAKRLPSSACSAETVEQVIKFIGNPAKEQALLLPGHVPGFKPIDVTLLPSNLTKQGLWKSIPKFVQAWAKSLLDILNFVIYRISFAHLF